MAKSEHVKKIVAYKRLIAAKKYYIKEIRAAGFKFNTDLSYGSIFVQVENFGESWSEATNNL